ncbi:alpha/beta hydrolase [Streptomyces chartreusis]|uniref:alpha/beta hydrolase n=1 Tax=Streptomyces chartreusis TaxID=1969 RepID=UPI0033F36228
MGAKERTATFAAYKDLARRCEQRDPELMRHVSTSDTARDLDRLRQAVGDPQLTYLGISYGTILAATYANLFPDKVRAMVVDGNWDPQAWTNHGSGDDARLTSFIRLRSDWPLSPDRYRGPWNRPTAHPILVIGNAYDPSTPESAARAMARELADARLLTLNGYAHTALLNPSSCIQAHESRYLIDGVLPPPWTTCQEQDAPPFATPRPSGGIATGGGGLAGTTT